MTRNRIAVYRVLQRRMVDFHRRALDLDDEKLAATTFMLIVHCDLKIGTKSVSDQFAPVQDERRSPIKRRMKESAVT